MKAIMLAAGAGTRCCPFAYLASKLFRQIRVIPPVEYMLSWFGGTPEVEKPKLAAYLIHLDEWYDVGTLEQVSNVNIKTVSRKGEGK